MINNTGRVSIQSILDEFKLVNLTENVNLSQIWLTGPEINRPALQLTGFFDFFESDRLQIIGMVEHMYMLGMDKETLAGVLTRLFNLKIPCIVICRGLSVIPEMLELAAANGVPVLQTQETTSDFISEVIKWLKVQLAPCVTVHGVLVDIYGEGVLIMGESGIGKSETALELIRRGHRLVADDSVEIRKVSGVTLVGACPEIIRYFIELRGIGVVDVRQMFGVESVKTTQNIDLVIMLEVWDNDNDYDRLGLTDEFMEFLGIKVVCHNIPIRPGRNLAIICETAAVNHRLKKMGYRASEALSAKINESFKK